MEDQLVIRTGTPEDVHDVMDLAKMSTDENGFANPNMHKILQDVWDALHLNAGIVGLIGPPVGKPEGVILLRVLHPWYSDDLILEERAIFIHPDFRSAKGGRASRLCEFSKTTAEKLGLPLFIGVLSNQRTEAKIRLYERHFGKPAGAYFLHGATTGGAVVALLSER